MSKNSSSGEGPSFGCMFMLLAGVFAMPLVGLYLLAKGYTEEDDGKKFCGILLLVLGCIIWGYVLLNLN